MGMALAETEVEAYVGPVLTSIKLRFRGIVYGPTGTWSHRDIEMKRLLLVLLWPLNASDLDLR